MQAHLVQDRHGNAVVSKEANPKPAVGNKGEHPKNSANKRYNRKEESRHSRHHLSPAQY